MPEIAPMTAASPVSLASQIAGASRAAELFDSSADLLAKGGDAATLSHWTSAVGGGQSIVTATEQRAPIAAARSWLNEARAGVAADVLPTGVAGRIGQLADPAQPASDLSAQSLRDAASFARGVAQSLQQLGDRPEGVQAAADATRGSMSAVDYAKKAALDVTSYRADSFTHGVQAGANHPYEWSAQDMLANARGLTDDAATLLTSATTLTQHGEAPYVDTGKPFQGESLPLDVFARLNAAADSIGASNGRSPLGTEVYDATSAIIHGTRERPEAPTAQETARVQRAIDALRSTIAGYEADPTSFAKVADQAAHQYDGAFGGS